MPCSRFHPRLCLYLCLHLHLHLPVRLLLAVVSRSLLLPAVYPSSRDKHIYTCHTVKHVSERGSLSVSRPTSTEPMMVVHWRNVTERSGQEFALLPLLMSSDHYAPKSQFPSPNRRHRRESIDSHGNSAPLRSSHRAYSEAHHEVGSCPVACPVVAVVGYFGAECGGSCHRVSTR